MPPDQATETAAAATETAAATTAAAETSTAAAATTTQQAAAEAAATTSAATAEVKPAEAKPQGAPEKYDFKAPEGSSAFDDKVLGAYGDVAKTLNLTQEGAQSILDKVAPVIQARQMEALKGFYDQIGGMPETWAATTKADKEIGGDKLAENLAIATKVRDLGGPDLVKVLDVTGLGNHPAVIKAFAKFGRMLSEDKFVAPEGGPRGDHKPGDRLYGKKP